MTFLKAIGELLLGVLVGVGALLLVGGILFLGAIGATAIGWLAGVFVNWVFGGLVINGVNLLLGTALVKANLPVITATLGFFAYIVRGGAKNAGKVFEKKKGVNTNAKG